MDDVTAGVGFVPAAAAAAALDNALGAGTGMEIVGDGRTAGVEQSTTSVARDGADLGAGIGVNTVLGAGTGLGTTEILSSSISYLWIIAFFQLPP